ncbi:hypothetical protein B9G98_04079 [Wickerhamiella sorbophila]|uniref:Synaptobrevin homolog YKT6 n=1 Tax=Wickerhamiella sorbophila TaxID=45607 RepID=A0A2T0FNB3_9ASCO|nr:hypothetical protein B9G98_04079 [Wickerhamiella sorbophila]PRT56459.1 hypothetical protein B9G98_04079 [Wickerhamiella sorbophila]
MGPLIYSAVFDGSKVLAEYEAQTGPGRKLGIAIASKASPGTQMSYTAGSLSGHYLARSDNAVFVAVCDQTVPRRVPFALLQKLDSAIPNLADANIFKFLQETCEGLDGSDGLQLARQEIDQVRNVVVENIDHLMERGERLSLLVDRTNDMNSNAELFRRRTHAVSRKFWWQNARMATIALATIGGVLFFLYELFRV